MEIKTATERILKAMEKGGYASISYGFEQQLVHEMKQYAIDVAKDYLKACLEDEEKYYSDEKLIQLP